MLDNSNIEYLTSNNQNSVRLNKKPKINHLEVILKITERCNLNCDYCYVFNRGGYDKDDSPPIFSLAYTHKLGHLLHEACDKYQIDFIRVDLHGGEPLLYKPRRFDELCSVLKSYIPKETLLEFCLQTNGVLINDEWIDVFEKHKVAVAVSLDGVRQVNDLHRLDHKGKSSYEDTVRGLRILQDAFAKGRLVSRPSLLSVINPAANGSETYRHFVGDLNLKSFDFLLPDIHHGDTGYDLAGVSRFIKDALNEWFADNDPTIYVRLFESQMSALAGKPAYFMGMGQQVAEAFAFTIGTNGNIYVDDTLRPTQNEIFAPIGNLMSVTLTDILDSPQMRLFLSESARLPDGCSDCIWKKICGGGRLVNRFDPAGSFSKRTVLCEPTRSMLSQITSTLLQGGFDREKLIERLT